MGFSVLQEDQNFLGLNAEFSSFENSMVVIQQLPYEHTSSYGEGSKNGPNAIIKASHFVEFFDEEINDEICEKIGICTLVPLKFSDEDIDEIAIEKIAVATSNLMNQGKFVVSLGGEHTITLGTVKTFHKYHPKLSVLQIDAHSDLRDEYMGNKYSHASVMARINEMNVHISQVGVRAQSTEEYKLIEASGNIDTLYDHQMNDIDWIEDVVNGLNEEVYVTIDTDGLDPSLVPAVGTPEPGGLTWSQCLELFRRLAKSGKKVVGLDIVELSPINGDVRTEYIMAKLLYKILGYLHKYQKF